MKNPSNHQIGEFLYRFFRKRVTSFQANIYKSGITGASKDIHRARLDVKKIFAIIDLLRVVRSKKETDPRYDRLFKKLYRASGCIREIQVNLLLLTRPEFSKFCTDPLIACLVMQEGLKTDEFLSAIRKFDEKELSRMEEKLKKEVTRITPVTLQKKTNRYVLAKNAMIFGVFDSADDKPDLHKVRMHIKELSTILTLLISMNLSSKLEKSIDSLNKTEMMIGDWHDRVVLEETVDKFLRKPQNLNEDQSRQMRALHEMLIHDNEIRSRVIAGDIRKLIQSGFLLRDPQSDAPDSGTPDE